MNRYGWIDLPGIGIFEGQHQKAYIDHKDSKIYPSKLVVSFHHTEGSKAQELVDHICEETGYKNEDIENLLGQLSLELALQLRAGNQAEFYPLGMLSLKGDEYTFSSYGYNLNERFYGMEELPISPAIKTVEEILPLTVLPQSSQQSKSIFKEFKYLFWAIGLLWLIFLGLMFCPPRSSDPDSNKTKHDVRKNDSTPTLKDSVQLSTVDTSKHMATDSVFTQKQSDKIPIDSFQDEVILTDKNISTMDTVIKNKNCIIIVGSFKVESNADRLEKKIRQNGQQAFRGRFQDFYRVGVKFDCFHQNLQEVLIQLKAKYHPQAWILKYNE